MDQKEKQNPSIVSLHKISRMVEIRHLQYFLAVAEDQHVTRAAARLKVAQPAVSQQIQVLERRLGTRLFDRVGRRVQLTAAGRALLPHAQATLAAMESGVAEVRAASGSLGGSFAVGLVQAAGALQVPELLARYRSRFPQVEVTIKQEGSGTMISAVRDGGLDAAFVGLLEGQRPSGIVARWLLSEPLVVVVPPGHRFAGHRQLRLTDLRGEAMATLTQGTGLRAVVERACREAGFEPRIVCQTGDLEALLDLCAVNLAMAIVPASAASASGLEVMQLIAPTIQRHLALVSRPPGSRSPAARAFLTLADAYYDNEPPHSPHRDPNVE